MASVFSSINISNGCKNLCFFTGSFLLQYSGGGTPDLKAGGGLMVMAALKFLSRSLSLSLHLLVKRRKENLIEIKRGQPWGFFAWAEGDQ